MKCVQIVAMTALVSLAPLFPALAADPDPASVQTPIKGATVMGDKGRPAPDGFSWAPQTRDQPASGHAARNAPNTMPDPGEAAAKSLSPGQDPGTPASPVSSGPNAGVTDGKKP